MEIIPHTIISNWIFPLKCGFGIGYDIGQKYQPIWGSEQKQSSGFVCTLSGNNKWRYLFIWYLMPRSVFPHACASMNQALKKTGCSFADWINSKRCSWDAPGQWRDSLHEPAKLIEEKYAAMPRENASFSQLLSPVKLVWQAEISPMTYDYILLILQHEARPRACNYVLYT